MILTLLMYTAVPFIYSIMLIVSWSVMTEVGFIIMMIIELNRDCCWIAAQTDFHPKEITIFCIVIFEKYVLLIFLKTVIFLRLVQVVKVI